MCSFCCDSIACVFVDVQFDPDVKKMGEKTDTRVYTILYPRTEESSDDMLMAAMLQYV
jgi:hypothetical protein